MQQRHDVVDHRFDLLGYIGALVEGLVEIDGWLLVVIGEHEIVVLDDLAELVGKPLPIEQVAQAHTAARGFILVRRSDATPGRADLLRPTRLFAREVELHVIRQNEGTRRTDLQPFPNRDTLVLELLDLAADRVEVRVVLADVDTTVLETAGVSLAVGERFLELLLTLIQAVWIWRVEPRGCRIVSVARCYRKSRNTNAPRPR